jgi:hypothetical protein
VLRGGGGNEEGELAKCVEIWKEEEDSEKALKWTNRGPISISDSYRIFGGFFNRFSL